MTDGIALQRQLRGGRNDVNSGAVISNFIDDVFCFTLFHVNLRRHLLKLINMHKLLKSFES